MTIKDKGLTFFVRSVLITDDLPTLGYPTNPTDIACLSLFKRENCLNTDRREFCKQQKKLSSCQDYDCINNTYIKTLLAKNINLITHQSNKITIGILLEQTILKLDG